MKTAEELENRMVHARAVAPTPAAHCGHCFGEGRNAALHVLEHGVGTPADRMTAAHAAPALVADIHCGHCFTEGREAAIRAIEEGEPVLTPGHDLPGAKPPEAATKPGETPPGAAAKPGEPPAKPVHLPKT